jgi:uncharacterized membrane protein (DUF106 family)
MAELLSDPTLYLMLIIFIIIIAILYIIRYYINKQNNVEIEPELVSEDLTPNQYAFAEHRLEHHIAYSACPFCGAISEEGQTFCGSCGERL